MNTIEIILTAIGTAAAVIGCIGGIMVYLFKREREIAISNTRISSIEHDIETKPCVRHTEILNNQENKCRQIDEEITRISKRVDIFSSQNEILVKHETDITEIKGILRRSQNILLDISKWIMKMDATMIEQLAQKASPLKMTPAGEFLFTESHADKALNKIQTSLLHQIEECKPRTKYDVEQLSVELLLKSTGDEAFDEVKQFIYNSPDKFTFEGREIRFDIYAIIRLMSIRLRDLYIGIHDEVI